MGRGKADTIEGIRAKPRGAAFRASEVQRGYRELLDRAREEPQQILDADGSAFAVEPWNEMRFARRFQQIASAAAQLRAVYGRHRDESAAEWAALTPFPWLAGFDADEVADFAEELVDLVLDASNRGDLEELEGFLAAARSTGEIYNAPELLDQMTGELDPVELVEVFPPSVYKAERGSPVDA
jgi:hypothetical protein